MILVGSVITGGDLLRLVNRKPIAKASENVILVERGGKASGIIVVETENKGGYVILEGEYTDLITGKHLSGRYDVSPYEVLVLTK